MRKTALVPVLCVALSVGIIPLVAPDNPGYQMLARESPWVQVDKSWALLKYPALFASRTLVDFQVFFFRMI